MGESFGRIFKQFFVVASVAVVIVLSVSASAFAAPVNSAANTESQSDIVINGDWSKYIEFVYNRGKGTEEHLDYLKKQLSIANVSKFKKRTPYKSLVLSVSTYAFRSPRFINEIIVPLLDKGVSFELVSDANTQLPFEAPSDDDWALMTPVERATFVRNHSQRLNGGFKFSVKDYWHQYHYRKKNALAADALNTLAPKYPGQISMITQPGQFTPEKEDMMYPYMHHFKSITLYKKNAQNKRHAIFSFVGSANLTDADLSRAQKLSESSFRPGANYEYIHNTEGNIQFSAMFKHPGLIKSVLSPLKLWKEAYKKGAHFNSVNSSSDLRPRRFVFNDSKSGNQSHFYSIASRGLRNGENNQDVLDVVDRLIFKPGTKLISVKEAQFVYAHDTISRRMRQRILESPLFRDLEIFVHRDQAIQPYSSLDSLLFAPQVDNAENLRLGQKISKLPSLDPAMWLENVNVYDGYTGPKHPRGDLLHSKLSFYEIRDPYKKNQYVVVWGSANKSTKASKYNADTVNVLMSQDPLLKEQVLNFFEGLRGHKRMKPFINEWMKEKFKSYLSKSSTVAESDEFINLWVMMLSQTSTFKAKDLLRLENLLEKISKKDNVFLEALKWAKKYDQIMRFDFSIFSLLLEFVGQAKPSPIFIKELEDKMTYFVPEKRRKSAIKDMGALLRRFEPEALIKSKAEVSAPVTPKEKAKLLCGEFLKDYNSFQGVRHHEH